MGRKSIGGGIITLVSQTLQTVVKVSATVLLARYLSPSDFGTVAMVLGVAAFANIFRDMGLSGAAIQRRTLNTMEQANLFWLNICVGFVLTLLMLSASPFVARFFARPELVGITCALAPTFIISALSAQSGAYLVRNMRYGKKGIAEVAGAVLGLAVGLGLARAQFGPWALVWGNLTSVLATSVLIFILSPFRPKLPQPDVSVREFINYGMNVLIFDLANYCHRQLDNILIGRWHGASALGFYTRAYDLLMLPIHAIRGPILMVAFPALSRLQDYPSKFLIYYKRITMLTAFASMAVVGYLVIHSEVIIDVALGKEWAPILPVFKLLAMVAFIQPAASLRGVVLLSTGRTRRYAIWGVINAVTVSLAFAIGVKWGPEGVATGYVVATYALLVPSLYFIFPGTPLSPADFWKSILPSTVAALTAMALDRLRGPVQCSGWAAITPLLERATVFMVIYIGVFLFFADARATARYVVGAVASFVRRENPAGNY